MVKAVEGARWLATGSWGYILDARAMRRPARRDERNRMGSGDRTGRQRLLKLVGLLVVLENQGVQLGAASDLELGLRRLLVLLYPRRCINPLLARGPVAAGRSRGKAIGVVVVCFFSSGGRGQKFDVHLASLRRQISMN